MRVLIPLVLVITACGSSPSVSAMPSGAAADGLEALVADLEAAGAQVALVGSFDPTPISRRAALVCASGQKIRVYIYGSQQERAVAASSIDPNDPSHVGRAIIEWRGNPRFWQRDRMIVLYLGKDQATEMLLSSILGPPFASGPGRDGGGEGC